MTDKGTKKTYKGVDILKLLAAIGVVGIHVGAKYIILFGRLAVPCFLLISGIFFFRKYDFLDEDAQVGYLKNYLNRLGMLYLSWQILYLPFVVKILINYMRTHSNTLMSWVNYVFRFFVPFGFTLSGKAIIGYNGWIQSWYLIALWIGLPILIYASKLINDKLMLAICLVIECFFIISSEFGFIGSV